MKGQNKELTKSLVSFSWDVEGKIRRGSCFLMVGNLLFEVDASILLSRELKFFFFFL